MMIEPSYDLSIPLKIYWASYTTVEARVFDG